MPDLEIKSVNLLGTPVNYAYAVKAGPWIFLTGHEAFDFASGIAEEVAGPPGFPRFGRPRSRREGDFILGRMPGRDLSSLARGLRRAGILVRHFSTPSLRDAIRISIGTPAEIAALVRALTPLARAARDSAKRRSR